MGYTHGFYPDGLPHVSGSLLLRLHPLLSKYAGKRSHQPLRQQRSAGYLFPGKDGYIYLGATELQQGLASFDVVAPRIGLLPPRLVALKIEAYSIERHAGALIHEGVVNIHMMKQLIQSQRVISIQQRFDGTRVLVPLGTELGEPLSLNDVLPINAGPGDRVKHIIELIMGRAVEPELPHWSIYFPVVHHSVAHHRGRDTLYRKLAIVFFREFCQGIIKHLYHQFGNRLANIVQDALRLFHAADRYAGIYQEMGGEVVSPALLELFTKVFRPVLAAALPAIHVHVFQYFPGQHRVCLSESGTKPIIELSPYGFFAKLIALQPPSRATGGVGMSQIGRAHV